MTTSCKLSYLCGRGWMVSLPSTGTTFQWIVSVSVLKLIAKLSFSELGRTMNVPGLWSEECACY